MKRREEIEQQAEEYRQPYRDGGYRLSSTDVREAFEEGAEWADKTMIEKACNYLYAKTKISGAEIDKFRKAMEE